jgi:hypothetical protein
LHFVVGCFCLFAYSKIIIFFSEKTPLKGKKNAQHIFEAKRNMTTLCENCNRQKDLFDKMKEIKKIFDTYDEKYQQATDEYWKVTQKYGRDCGDYSHIGTEGGNAHRDIMRPLQHWYDCRNRAEYTLKRLKEEYMENLMAEVDRQIQTGCDKGNNHASGNTNAK